MVSDALHDVPYHPGVEEAQRQLHQLYQEVGDEWYVDARVHVQQYPAPYELHGKPGNGDDELGCQNQRDKAQVPVPNPDIHQWLRKEREYQLQEAHSQHPQE